jgi:hypothetical protein
LAAVLLGIAALKTPRAIPGIRPGPQRYDVSVPGMSAMNRLSVSADGGALAIFAGNRILVRDLNTGEEQPVEGTEGAGAPFWSPDGKWIAFVAGGKLRKTLVTGGVPQVLGDARTNLAGAWSKSGDILIGEVADGLFRVRETGGGLERVTRLAAEETRHILPQFLPDGKHYLYVAATAKPGGHILYAGALGTEVRTAIMPIASQAVYADGHLLFVQEGRILAQAFDPVTLRRSGTPSEIGGPVQTMAALASAIQIGAFSAASRTLAFAAPPARSGRITVIRNWGR